MQLSLRQGQSYQLSSTVFTQANNGFNCKELGSIILAKSIKAFV